MTYARTRFNIPDPLSICRETKLGGIKENYIPSAQIERIANTGMPANLYIGITSPRGDIIFNYGYDFRNSRIYGDYDLILSLEVHPYGGLETGTFMVGKLKVHEPFQGLNLEAQAMANMFQLAQVTGYDSITIIDDDEANIDFWKQFMTATDDGYQYQTDYAGIKEGKFWCRFSEEAEVEKARKFFSTVRVKHFDVLRRLDNKILQNRQSKL